MIQIFDCSSVLGRKCKNAKTIPKSKLNAFWSQFLTKPNIQSDAGRKLWNLEIFPQFLCLIFLLNDWKKNFKLLKMWKCWSWEETGMSPEQW